MPQLEAFSFEPSQENCSASKRFYPRQQFICGRTICSDWEANEATAGPNRITAYEIHQCQKGLEVPVDIKPQSCPNPLNVNSKGNIPVAILGTASQVDPSSVQLEGVSSLAILPWSLEDVATPFEPFIGKEDAGDCTTEGADGYTDLTLHFDVQEIVTALDPVNDGDVLVLTLTGHLKPEFGGTPIAGEDVVVILKKGQ